MPICSIALSGLPGDVRKLFDRAAQLSAASIEVDGRRQLRAADLTGTARRQLRQLLNERTLGLSGLCFPVRGSIADEHRLNDRIELAMETMQLGRDLGAPYIIVPFRLPTETEHERTVDVLRSLARHGDHVGCKLILRTGDDEEQLKSLLQSAADSAPIGLQFDPAACVLRSGSLEKAMALLSSSIEQLRVNDGLRVAGSAGKETAVGRGEVDYELLAALVAQLPITAVVVSPDDPNVAPIEDGLTYANAVFGSLNR